MAELGKIKENRKDIISLVLIASKDNSLSNAKIVITYYEVYMVFRIKMYYNNINYGRAENNSFLNLLYIKWYVTDWHIYLCILIYIYIF